MLYEVITPVWMDHETGQRVAEGTAAVGAPDLESALRMRIAATPEPNDVRILADLEVGQSAVAPLFKVSRSRFDTRMGVIVEPLPDYTAASSWGGPIRITSYNVCYTKLLR